MSRFFVSVDSIDMENSRITITGEDVKHIRDVLRSRPGDMLTVSDGEKYDYDVIIESMDREAVTAKISARYENRTEPPVNVTLFQGLPKADKLEYIVQKCVELGIKRIVPVLTARTVVKINDPKDVKSKTARWNRIALEAAKQCDRGVVPVVTEPVRFDEALNLASGFDLKLFPYEEAVEGSLKDVFSEFKKLWNVEGRKPSVALFIGPEGGFEPAEAEKARDLSFCQVTLGPRILRTETAGMAVLSVIMYEIGDMSGT